MKKINRVLIVVLVLFAVAAGGYSLGSHRADSEKQTTANSEPKTENRKLLYYRNPMGLPDTSPVPKKDAMGMDYVPVYDGEAGDEEGAVNISVEKVQKLGVKSEAAAMRVLNKTIHATGRIEIDERRTYTIAPKFEGWVERLYVNSTGEIIRRGQALFDVYSPELVSVQREYSMALQGAEKLENADEDARASMKQLADASLSRLKNWDITPGEIRQLTAGKSRRSLTYYAQVSGIVLEKKAVQGMRFMPGDVLYQIADLSQVWVLADINEQDVGQVNTGREAQVSIGAYPDKSFTGKIAFVYPLLNAATRTVQVRIEIANPQGLLKPAMFASVSLPTDNGAEVLAVPTSSVIDSGRRRVVLVQLAEGRFEPREVRLGSRSEDYVEVLGGISAGERVVTSANFLIDAESNLKAALSGMSASAPSLNAGWASARQPDETASHSIKPANGQVDAYQDRTVGLKPELPAKMVGHQAQGILEEINADGTVSITHEPITSLGWPGMTMDFQLANSSLIAGIKPGSVISFELVQRKPDEWVITKLQARAQHEGH